MRCGNVSAEDAGGQKINVVLEFRRKDLLYDIENYLFIEGSVMTEIPDHVRHMVQDVGQEGDVDVVSRLLWLLHGRATELLYPYTKYRIEMDWFDDRFEEPRIYNIAMSVPTGFSQTTLIYLERLIHTWMVYNVVMEWLSITHPEKAAVWAQKIADAESEIRSCLNIRMGPTRIKMHPF